MEYFALWDLTLLSPRQVRYISSETQTWVISVDADAVEPDGDFKILPAVLSEKLDMTFITLFVVL